MTRCPDCYPGDPAAREADRCSRHGGQLWRATDGRQVVVAPFHRDCYDDGKHPVHLLLNGSDFAVPSDWDLTPPAGAR